MELAAQLLINTLQIGVVYVLFSLGLTIIFGVMKIVNFAHGEFFAVAALLMAVLVNTAADEFGLPLWVGYAGGFVGAVIAVLVLGLIVYRPAFERYLRDLVGSFILSVGLLLLLQGILLEVFGGVPRVVPRMGDNTISILGGRITELRLAVSLIALAIMLLAYLLIQRTRLGMALRAMSEDHEAAMLQGIRYRRIALYGFLIGSVLAATAGALIAPLTAITPAIGGDYLVKAFIIVIVGGLGSITGAISAGFLIALIESIGGFFLDPSLTTVALFMLVIIFLVLRPQGIMGHAEK
ncbi:MAG TPA: branched-chain amino acid ABC transporter permease [Alphaproteobacteria bacterium]|nr:branched-chain amino acid ABC transporter permease [Alphaproteobacteria bacterium]